MNSEKPQKISILGIFNGQFPKNIRRPLEKHTENFLKHGEFSKILGVFSDKTRREFSCGVKPPLGMETFTKWRYFRNKRGNLWYNVLLLWMEKMAKKRSKEISIRSSAAEYLTFVAATGGSNESVEVRYEDEGAL